MDIYLQLYVLPVRMIYYGLENFREHISRQKIGPCMNVRWYTTSFMKYNNAFYFFFVVFLWNVSSFKFNCIINNPWLKPGSFRWKLLKLIYLDRGIFLSPLIYVVTYFTVHKMICYDFFYQKHDFNECQCVKDSGNGCKVIKKNHFDSLIWLFARSE